MAENRRRRNKVGWPRKRNELRLDSVDLIGSRFLDAYPQVIPGSLSRYRIAVAVTIRAVRGQQFRNEMIEQESPRGFRAVEREIPGTGAFADRVPSPHGVAVDSIHEPDLTFEPAVSADHPHPIVIVKVERRRPRAVHVEPILTED